MEIDEAYLNGCIYEITCNDATIMGDNGFPLRYVGSSKDFETRINKHYQTNYDVNGKNYNIKLYKNIREYGDFDNFSITKLYDYPCLNKRELCEEEERMRLHLNANLNCIKAYRSVEYTKQYTLEYSKKYYNEHREIRKKKALDYYYNNRDKVLEREKKKYYENKTLNLVLKTKKAIDTINIYE